MVCFSTEWGDKRDMRAVCSGTRQVLRGGINNAVSGFVMQRQLAPPLLNRPNHRHGGPRWRDTDLSVFLSFFLPLVFLLFLPLELTRQVNYIWEIRRRNSDEELSTEISEIFSLSFSSRKVYTLRYPARKWYNRFLFSEQVSRVEIRTRKVYNTGRLSLGKFFLLCT